MPGREAVDIGVEDEPFGESSAADAGLAGSPATRGQAPEVAPPGPHDGLERGLTAAVTALPMVAVGFAAWLAWDSALHWQDLAILAVCYVPVGLGVTVGFHRLFTHRSFQTGPFLRGLLAALGSAAVEGPVIEWVANHRMHHAHSDREGDPHSPHVGHGGGWRGALRGLAHAHLLWLFRSDFANQERYAPDLLKDPVIRFIDRTFVLWTLLGLAVPFGLGLALTGSVVGGLTGLLWGGAVRIFLLHHATFAINSLCHFFGRRRYVTQDESRNLAWLAPLSFGEAWHNNHHAFPTSAAHGLRRWELDPSALVIGLLERLGLVWNVVSVPAERRHAKSVA
ncbi:MAG: acyl-CoA desaturase [Actinomycetota bacterium]|nr:acyl-CoA desaturase [Actinomycetota bacterium]